MLMNSSLDIFLPVSPAWILLCFLGAAIYAAALYYRSKDFKEVSGNQRLIKSGLGALRFLAVSIIALLLLNPLLESSSQEEDPSIVVFLADNSESAGQALSSGDSAAFVEAWRQMGEELPDEIEVAYFNFASELAEGDQLDFSGKSTDLSLALSGIADRYYNRNLGAVVLLTDGIFNQGRNPLYASDALSAPVFSIALGDTTPKRDLRITKVYSNEIAYLDDRFEVLVDVQASALSGEAPNLILQRLSPSGGLRQNAWSESDTAVRIANEFWSQSARFLVDADVPGFHHYRLTASIAGDDGSKELIYGNNSWDFYVEVLDSRKKILLLANAPHPDLSALKQAISSNMNYEAVIAMANEFAGDYKDYSLVALHGLPQGSQNAMMNAIRESGVSTFFILTQGSDIQAFNAAQPLLKIQANSNQTNDVTATVVESFQLFGLNDDFQPNITDLPPITVPFGEYQLAAAAQVLLKQKIGAVATDYPLLAFFENQGQKQAVMTGEGLWRWRLYDFLIHGNHESFDQLISKTVQYLSIEVDKRRFRAGAMKSIFSDNERVILEAQLYNANYEAINEPEVNVTITHEDGTEYPFVFSRSGNLYELDAGYLPEGSYTFAANTNYAGEDLNAQGVFSVKPLNLELSQITANHSLLYLLSDRFGGEVFLPGEMDDLKQALSSSNSIAPELYTIEKTQGAINWRWLFFVVLLFLSTEWFVRKYLGTY